MIPTTTYVYVFLHVLHGFPTADFLFYYRFLFTAEGCICENC